MARVGIIHGSRKLQADEGSPARYRHIYLAAGSLTSFFFPPQASALQLKPKSVAATTPNKTFTIFPNVPLSREWHLLLLSWML